MSIETPLSQNGAGFVTFNRGASGENQFGLQSTIDATSAVATAGTALINNARLS